jgi:hypothetical protein
MILLDAIDFIIGFFTLRWLLKKGPEAVESGLKQSYAESAEAKKMDALAHADERSRKKEPIQPPQTTTASSAPDRV